MFSILNQYTEKAYKELESKKEETIKFFLIRKGFDNLIEEAKTKNSSRFPVISCFIEGEWENYYVNDGSPDGVFICGFKLAFDHKESNTSFHSFNIGYDINS